MAIKKNIIKADLKSYPPYLIMGQPKIGKSSLFRDLVLHLYGTEDKGVLISFGSEEGYLALDKLQYERAKVWNAYEDYETKERGFSQIVDELIENKESLGIELVALDTFDEMVEVAIKEVFEIHRELKGSYPKSLNDALGSYGNGRKKVISLMRGEIDRLRDAGYAVFVIAHTKNKDKTDPITGETYEQITNSLNADYYGSVGNIAQMIVNIILERDIKDGKQVGERRMMYFRDNGIVEAGGRFTDMPEKLPLSAENFMKAFEQGVRNSTLSGKPLTDAELKKRKEVEEKDIKKQSELNKEKDLKKRKEANFAIIKEAMMSKPEIIDLIKPLLTKYKISSFEDMDSIDIKALDDIISVIS